MRKRMKLQTSFPARRFMASMGSGIDKKMPEGIALAPDGKLIVAEVGAKRIIEIDPANGNVTEIAGNLPIGLAAAPGGLPTNIPTGVGVGASGTIYFSSDIENAIYQSTR
jgi:DNA-binding beta-propeller fold protein YncE